MTLAVISNAEGSVLDSEADFAILTSFNQLWLSRSRAFVVAVGLNVRAIGREGIRADLLMSSAVAVGSTAGSCLGCLGLASRSRRADLKELRHTVSAAGAVVDTTPKEVLDFFRTRLSQFETANWKIAVVALAISWTLTTSVLSSANHALAIWAVFLLLGLLAFASTSIQSGALELAGCGECASTNNILALAFATFSANIGSIKGSEDSSCLHGSLRSGTSSRWAIMALGGISTFGTGVQGASIELARQWEHLTTNSTIVGALAVSWAAGWTVGCGNTGLSGVALLGVLAFALTSALDDSVLFKAAFLGEDVGADLPFTSAIAVIRAADGSLRRRSLLTCETRRA